MKIINLLLLSLCSVFAFAQSPDTAKNYSLTQIDTTFLSAAPADTVVLDDSSYNKMIWMDQFGLPYHPNETKLQSFGRYYVYANYYYGKADIDSAETLYKYLDENAPFSSYVAMKLAYIYRDKGDTSKINYNLTRVIEKVTKNNGYFQDPYYKKFLDNSIIPDRIPFWEYSAIDSKSYEFNFNQAFSELLYLRQKIRDYYGIIDLVNRKISIINEKSWAYSFVAFAYLNLNKHKSALIYALKSIKLKNNEDANFVAGIAYYNLGNKSAGCIYLSRAASLGRVDALEFIQEYCK